MLRKKDDINVALSNLNRFETSARRSFHQAEASFRRHQRYAHEALKTDVKLASETDGEVAAFTLKTIALIRANEVREQAYPKAKPASAPAQAPAQPAADASKLNETKAAVKTNLPDVT